MSNTASIITTAIGFLGSASASIAAFVRSTKKTEAQVISVIRKVEDEVNLLLNEIDHLTGSIVSLKANISTPAAPSAPVAKSTAPRKAASAAKKSSARK